MVLGCELRAENGRIAVVCQFPAYRFTLDQLRHEVVFRPPTPAEARTTLFDRTNRQNASSKMEEVGIVQKQAAVETP